MKYLLAGIDRLSGAFGWIAGLLIVPLVFASVFEVISRYVFNAPTIWAYEIGYMATGTNFFLGMSYALRERAHIRIDVLYSHFSPRTQSLVDALGYTFLMLPFVIWLTWRLGLYAYDAWIWGERSGNLHGTRSSGHIGLSLFSAFCCLRFKAWLSGFAV